MRTDELIVLKLGGSVLRDREALAQATHEVYRWWREGWRVVAVVSALEGETDRLQAEARAVVDEPSPEHCATLLATGELRAASLLGLALQRSGLRAAVLTPHQLNLRVTGAGLDAEPDSIDAGRMLAALDDAGVAVVPGFIGLGADGGLRTLGRGGSDLSALFIAHAVGASACRLVKDVEGLFTRDPRLPGPAAKLLSHITFEDALKLNGGIVQHKAVRFARDRGLKFEVGALHAGFATVVGAPRTRAAERAGPGRPLRVAVLGLGTVGLGVYRRLGALPHLFTITGAVCRNTGRAASQGVDPAVLRAGASQADLLDRCDILVEAIGGLEPAGSVVEAALARGVHVVSANKSLIAARYHALSAVARESGASLRFSAAVGGAAPVIEAAQSVAATSGLVRIDGVLNGTVNFVLDALGRGVSFEAALADAQRSGLAEADPSRDLSGRDAADKLAVLCSVVTRGAHALDAANIPRDELSADAAARLAASCRAGEVVRQVASLDLSGDVPRGKVGLCALGRDHPLACTRGAGCVCCLIDGGGAARHVRAEGAGRWPTAESVLADCLDIHRGMPAGRAEPIRDSVAAGELV